VVENATILPHTYLGSSLDVAHSIVNRNIMVDVRRSVEVEIRDRALIGSTSLLLGGASRPSPAKSLPFFRHSPWQILSGALRGILPYRPSPSSAARRFSFNASERRAGLEEVSGAGNSRTV
jgi:hypothetical protein